MVKLDLLQIWSFLLIFWVRSNDAWKVGFLSKNFSEFDAYYINLVHNTNVAWGTPKYALIFNFLDFLETLWTKLKFQGGSIWFFWLLAHHYISKNTLVNTNLIRILFTNFCPEIFANQNQKISNPLLVTKCFICSES